MKNVLLMTVMVLISFVGGYFMRDSENSDNPSSTVDVVEQETWDEACVLKPTLAEASKPLRVKRGIVSYNYHDNGISDDLDDFSDTNLIKEIKVSPSTNLIGEVVIIARVQSGKNEIIDNLNVNDNIVYISHEKSNKKDEMKLTIDNSSVASSNSGEKQVFLKSYAYCKSFIITSKTYICQVLPGESTTCFGEDKKFSLDFIIEAKARSPGIT